ncbi:MAG: UDP binding domain-containing protein, partial [Pseudomonadota bacterium]
ARLIRAAREINDGKPQWVIERVAEAAADTRPVIACLGLAYKPDVDDLRESPSIQVVAGLIEHNLGEVLVVEPFIDTLPAPLQGARLADASAAVQQADIVVLLTGHAAFRNLRLSDLDGKIVIDACGLLKTA